LRAANELIVEAYDDKNWTQIGALLANMQRTVIRFQVFVENLIDIGSVQAGRFYVRPRRVDYNRIVNDALSEFRPSIAMRENAVELCSTIPSPCYVMGDPQRLVQVFFNLLSNALKYGGEDSAIQVSVFVEKGAVYTEVIDHGPGIPEQELAQIFQRYYRGKSVESEGMGIGLGLAIAREIIEQHGGEINVRSDKANGTCFWFRLPLANAT
jgi:signal transduction histidine kinase